MEMEMEMSSEQCLGHSPSRSVFSDLMADPEIEGSSRLQSRGQGTNTLCVCGSSAAAAAGAEAHPGGFMLLHLLI